ncbi:hypothetical protein NXS19_001043 [Fusarium pseudograminearum]|nr:hypothetical protein NXS19_001043 [Fusarium pseudograminearum]
MVTPKAATNHDVSAAQASGEVDHVSDQPPSVNAGANAHMQAPGQSILVKRENTINPVNNGPSDESKADGNSNVAMSEIKDIDLDDFIKRLLDAGYAGKVTKSVCLKNAEIVAICQRAREVFLSQPALLELDAPVKVVGDVHGQYTDVIRMFEMCGFLQTQTIFFSATTLIEESNHWRQFCCYSAISSNSPKTFSSSGETTSAPMSHEFMAFTTNASEGAMSKSGRRLLTALTLFQSPRSLPARSSVFTEDCHQL